MTKKSRVITGGAVFDTVNVFILSLWAFLTVFPFYTVFIMSFGKYETMIKSDLYILPLSFDITPYQMIFKDGKFYHAFLISLFEVVVGVTVNMIMTVGCAYALSKKRMPGRNFALTFILITMFFGGGLIPYYIIVRSLGFVNNILVLIIPGAVNAFYLIIIKNYFNTLPESIEDSAKIDGANDIYILVKVVFPISAPIMATFGLFYSVDRWNDWFTAMLFISSTALFPLQNYLREMLINFSLQLNETAKSMMTEKVKVYMPSVQMASIVLSTIPILVTYPFLQKYFVKGIMIGSLKE